MDESHKAHIQQYQRRPACTFVPQHSPTIPPKKKKVHTHHRRAGDPRLQQFAVPLPVTLAVLDRTAQRVWLWTAGDNTNHAAGFRTALGGTSGRRFSRRPASASIRQVHELSGGWYPVCHYAGVDLSEAHHLYDLRSFISQSAFINGL